MPYQLRWCVGAIHLNCRLLEILDVLAEPFTYLIGGLLTQLLFDVKVTCKSHELTSFTPLAGKTCGQYMVDYFQTGFGYLVGNSSTTTCEYCPYKSGSEFAAGLDKTSGRMRDVSISNLHGMNEC